MSNVGFLGYSYEYGFDSKKEMNIAAYKLTDFFTKSMMCWDYNANNIRVTLTNTNGPYVPYRVRHDFVVYGLFIYRLNVIVTMDSKTRPNIPSIMEALDIEARLI